MNKTTSASLQGTVEKIVKSAFANAPDKAQIKLVGSDDLDRKIRIDNTLTDENGEEVSLRLGAQVAVTVETEAGSSILESRAGNSGARHPRWAILRSLTLDAEVQLGIVWGFPMDPEFHCVMCNTLLDLTIDLNTDENGTAVHEQCYVKRFIKKDARHCEQFPRTFLEAARPAFAAWLRLMGGYWNSLFIGCPLVIY